MVNTSIRQELKISLALRRAAIMSRVSYVTTIGAFEAFVIAVRDMRKINNDFDVKTVKEWINS